METKQQIADAIATGRNALQIVNDYANATLAELLTINVDDLSEETKRGIAKRIRKLQNRESKRNRVSYRNKTDALLTDWPTDFDAKKFKPLKRSDFATPIPFMKRKIVRLQNAIDAINAEIQTIESFGNVSDEQRKLLSKFATQFAKLKNSGIDADQFAALIGLKRDNA